MEECESLIDLVQHILKRSMLSNMNHGCYKLPCLQQHQDKDKTVRMQIDPATYGS